ncbi:MAG: hypothetical protein ABSH48_22945 [Verrucomicrobiota bacterium]|jgi:hypothetical protein
MKKLLPTWALTLLLIDTDNKAVIPPTPKQIKAATDATTAIEAFNADQAIGGACLDALDAALAAAQPLAKA